jgi:flagellar hook-basal body complex protein FliE
MNIPLLSRSVAPVEVTPPVTPDFTENFADVIGAAISQVEGAQASADQLASSLLTGGRGDVHTVALASQRAELSMEMFQQVRNKFVQAYQEVMKMPM